MNRYAIAKEAREWLGVKWVHQASLKGVACDCVGLIRGVYRELTGNEIPTKVNYPATWHLFKSEPWLYNECCKFSGGEIPLVSAGVGDILTFSFREKFVDHHVGIIVSPTTFVHSYMDVGKVVETRLDEVWLGRARHAFLFPGEAK